MADLRTPDLEEQLRAYGDVLDEVVQWEQFAPTGRENAQHSGTSRTWRRVAAAACIVLAVVFTCSWLALRADHDRASVVTPGGQGDPAPTPAGWKRVAGLNEVAISVPPEWTEIPSQPSQPIDRLTSGPQKVIGAASASPFAVTCPEEAQPAGSVGVAVFEYRDLNGAEPVPWLSTFTAEQFQPRPPDFESVLAHDSSALVASSGSCVTGDGASARTLRYLDIPFTDDGRRFLARIASTDAPSPDFSVGLEVLNTLSVTSDAGTSTERERADANISLRNGCFYSRDPFPRDAHGQVVTSLMPRWIEVIDLQSTNPLPGCIPRELLVTDLDGGKALAAYTVRAGFPEAGVLRPPLPVFSVDAALVGFSATDGGEPSFIPIETAGASGRVPHALIDNPPAPGDFSSVYR